MENCKRCGASLRCLAGESAHPDNWYCPRCRIEELETKLTLTNNAGVLKCHIEELEARIALALEISASPFVGFVADALHGRKLEDMPEEIQAILAKNHTPLEEDDD